MGLVLDWKASLGYRFDPFDPAIIKQDTIHGLDDLKERFNLWLIKGGQLGTIAGEKGVGKTLFLRWIENELAPRRSHHQHYFDAKAGGSADDLRRALGKHGLFARLLRAKDDQELLARLAKQQNVILIDNAGGLHKDALQLLGQVLDKTPSHAVLADTPERLAKLDLPLKDGLSLRIGKYGQDYLRTILTARINAAGVAGTHPFDDQTLARLFKEADGNPSQLLRLARERAIELSLKAGKGRTTTAPAQKKLISIRIANDTSASKTIATPDATGADAAALEGVVAEATAPLPEQNPAPKPALTQEEIALFDELASKEAKPRKTAKKAKRRRT